MSARTGIVVVMGVSGAGKSTVGRRLAERTGCPFLEGDDLHPASNVAKMARGEPLDDADRAPWLAAIAARIRAWAEAGGCGVVACSALKRRYREVLRAADPSLLFIHLDAGQELLAARLAGRMGHFMPPSLLASQLATLEPPQSEPGVRVVDAALPPEAIVQAILAHPARR